MNVQANPNDIELAINTTPLRVWALRTEHSFADVLRPGYFDTASEVGIRALDRIDVHASVRRGDELGLLLVNSVNTRGEIRVTPIVRYEWRQTASAA